MSRIKAKIIRCLFLLLLAPLQTGQAAPFYQGGINSFFKESASNKDDYAITAEKLRQTGANLYAYPAMDELYVSPVSTWNVGNKRGLEQLLEAIKSENAGIPGTRKDIAVIAVLKEKHHYENNNGTTSYCENYWLVKYLQDYEKAICNEQDFVGAGSGSRDIKEYWLKSLLLAAETLSPLSVEYPLVAYTVDDFGGHVLNAYHEHLGNGGDKYTHAEVDSLTAAGKQCKSCNLEFWPSMYIRNDVPRILADGHILGYENGATISDGDEITVDINFTLVNYPGTKKPKLRLEFFYSDDFEQNTSDEEYKDRVFKRVAVNDEEADRLLDQDVGGRRNMIISTTR